MSRGKKFILMGILSQLFVLSGISCCSTQRYPLTDHYNGKRYFNPGGSGKHAFRDMLKWWWEMKTVAWPKWIDDPPQKKPVQSVGEGKIKITYINQGTTLIQLEGCNILTDPIWSDIAGPCSWLGSKRIRNPGIAMDDLPPIDLVLISHNHYDHLDIQTLKKLYKCKRSKIITGLGVKRILLSTGIDNVEELDWWQQYHLKDYSLTVSFVPASHFSGRGLFDRNKTLWGGFVIQGKSRFVYFAGDSGYGNFTHAIKKKFPDICASILPLGNYEKRWYMKEYHMNPDDAVKIHKVLGSKISIGMHFATFLEHPEQGIDAHEIDLKEALKKYNVPESQFIIPKCGESILINDF